MTIYCLWVTGFYFFVFYGDFYGTSIVMLQVYVIKRSYYNVRMIKNMNDKQY